jgi:hypothetical protein
MTNYSVPEQAKELFVNGILENPLFHDQLPPEARSVSQNISFHGSDEPSIPINWRFAESISALKAYEAVILKVLLKRRYQAAPVKVGINTLVLCRLLSSYRIYSSKRSFSAFYHVSTAVET